MEWLPELNITEEDNEFLSDVELHKVKELQRSLRNYPEGLGQARIKIEIYEIYKMAIQRYKEEKIKRGRERCWNEMLQKAFDQMARIMANLLLTLMAGGIITLFFVVLAVLNSMTDIETALSTLILAIAPMAIISIIVGVVSYKRWGNLKKRFENANL